MRCSKSKLQKFRRTKPEIEANPHVVRGICPKLRRVQTHDGEVEGRRSAPRRLTEVRGGGGGEIGDQKSPEKHESLIERYRGPNHYLYFFFLWGGRVLIIVLIV